MVRVVQLDPYLPLVQYFLQFPWDLEVLQVQEDQTALLHLSFLLVRLVQVHLCSRGGQGGH